LKTAEDSGTVAENENIEEEADGTIQNHVANPQSDDVAMVIDESTSDSAPQVTLFLDDIFFEQIIDIVNRSLNPRLLPHPRFQQAPCQCLTQ
jgi:hypothetical protein